MNKPKIILFDKIGASDLGFITVAESGGNMPFEIKRVYWTYFTPQDVKRGGHAHKELEQIIFAVSGNIIFNTENLNREVEKFVLDSPSKGLYIPKLLWRDIQFSHNAVLLCIASQAYDENDYIRNYDEFITYIP